MATDEQPLVARLWEKCARLLALNSPVELIQINDIARTLITNIVEKPTEEKYRTVKCSNKIINQNILSKSGGVDFLICAGFVASIDEETSLKILSYIPKNNFNLKKSKLISNEDKKELEDCLEWLSSTIQDCNELWKIRKSRNPRLTQEESCAECIIQIKLPTGINVSGGFMGNDLFLDVKNFAKGFFSEQRFYNVYIWMAFLFCLRVIDIYDFYPCAYRASDVTLALPNSVKRSLEDECAMEERTLLDLGLAYRASLVAVLASSDSSQAFKVTPTRTKKHVFTCAYTFP